MPTEEEYQAGLQALSSLISGKVRSDGKTWSHAFEMMQIYLERLDLTERLSKLSVIHVAGTKGKGSTSAMIESILRSAGYKTGLYTSPHLIDVRERIRINGQPIDRDTFLRHLWHCYRVLEDKADEDAGKPAYFRFLTLLGFEIFLEQGVDVVILEVGLGGRLDATNCVRSPVVCGVTSLGLDHVELLGHTLPEIAREKAGIFKPGRPAFMVPQPEDAMHALQVVADRVGTPLQLTKPLDEYALPGGKPARDLQLGLSGEHQRINAALAVTLAAQWEALSPVAEARQGKVAQERARSVLEDGVIPEQYATGLELAYWPGRGQILDDPVTTANDTREAAVPEASPSTNGTRGAAPREPRLSFYLDGAHTAESMAACAHWFADAAHAVPAAPGINTQRVLLFNCMQERDPETLLAPLSRILTQRGAAPHSVLFVPPDSVYAKLGPADAAPDLQWQHALRATWERLNAATNGNGNGVKSSSPVGSTLNGGAAATGLRPLSTVSASTIAGALPPLPVLGGGAGGLLPMAHDATCGAVLPNLQVTLDWLRRCVRETPRLRLQVLVSGSLYLVGDLLRLLGRSTA